MNKLLVIGGIVVAAFVAFFAARYFFEEQDDLTGSWAVVAMEQQGKKASVKQVPFKQLTFSKGKVVWLVLTQKGLDEIDGPFRVNSSKNPKEIDLADPEDPGNFIRAIYELQADGLVLCIGDPRPRDMSGRGGSLLIFLKRK